MELASPHRRQQPDFFESPHGTKTLAKSLNLLQTLSLFDTYFFSLSMTVSIIGRLPLNVRLLIGMTKGPSDNDFRHVVCSAAFSVDSLVYRQDVLLEHTPRCYMRFHPQRGPHVGRGTHMHDNEKSKGMHGWGWWGVGLDSLCGGGLGLGKNKATKWLPPQIRISLAYFRVV